MPVRAIRAHPKVKADLGRVAMARGPLDLLRRGGRQRRRSQCHDRARDAGRGGSDGACPISAAAVAVDVPALRETWAAGGDSLYRTDAPVLEKTTGRFVPYYLWDNRAAGEMLVWVRART